MAENAATDPMEERISRILVGAIDPHVHSGSGLACAVQRLANASGDEVERRASCHFDGGASMMRQDENGNVIRRIVSPPAFPVGVRPVPTNGPEHVPAKNPGPNILEATGGEIIVNPGRTAVLAKQCPLKRAC